MQFRVLVGAQQAAEAAQLRAHEAEQRLLADREAAAQGFAAAGGSEARERAALLRAAAVARRAAERSDDDLRASEANSAASTSKWNQYKVIAIRPESRHMTCTRGLPISSHCKTMQEGASCGT